MHRSSNVVLIGDSLVFGLAAAGPGSTVYRVELCDVVGRAEEWRAAGFDPKAGWSPWSFRRATHGDLMSELEEHAYRLAPAAYAAWDDVLSDSVNAGVSEPERLTVLVERIMTRHRVTKKAIAERLNLRRQTLQEYCDGKTTGTMGTALILALEMLLNHPSFDYGYCP